MFTGLIEAVGSVQSTSAGEKSMRIAISFPSAAWELGMGESVNVDGVCQTVVAAGASTFTVEAVGDTLQKTTFRTLRRGAKVNLERALRADGRLGGHMVMGHVAGTARILSWGPAGGAVGSRFRSMVSFTRAGTILGGQSRARRIDGRGRDQPDRS